MNINIREIQSSSFKIMNFHHLMQIYENNYHLFKSVRGSLSNKSVLSTIMINSNVMQYEPITQSKYTDIFKFYYKYKPSPLSNTNYSIKPHIIFTLYKDAKLLEAKSIGQHKDFDSSIHAKIKINLNVYFWLKRILNNNAIYQ